MREGRKEGTPADVTSFPGVFLGSSSGLSRYPCRRREMEQLAPAADFRQPGWSRAAGGLPAWKVKSVNWPLCSALKSEGEREERAGGSWRLRLCGYRVRLSWFFWGFFWCERQIFQGSRSRCKHSISVAVAAVRAGAEDDGLRGKCLPTFSTHSLPKLLLFLSLSFLNFCHWLCCTGFALMPKQGPIHNDFTLPVRSDVYLSVFPFALPLGLKIKPLSFCCFLLFLDLPPFCWDLLVARCISAKMQHLDVASMVLYYRNDLTFKRQTVRKLACLYYYFEKIIFLHTSRH